MTAFGIAIPQTVEAGGFDGPAVQSFLGRAEALGFDSAWTQEQVFGTKPDLAPLARMRRGPIGPCLGPSRRCRAHAESPRVPAAEPPAPRVGQ